MVLLKPIGFLQELFHSEVLDFLFELIVKNDPSRKIILYNNTDKYNNISIYKQKYSNLTITTLNQFIPDMVNNVCEKFIVISYDNLFNSLNLITSYKNKLIFIAHSKNHIDYFTQLQLNYFSLTNLLSKDFMTPFVHNIKNNSTISYIHDKHTESNLNFLKTRKQKDKLDIIIIIGHFLPNNKDMNVLDKIAFSKRFLIIIYAPEITHLLKSYVERHGGFVYIGIKLTTPEIQSVIRFLNIKYMLLAPPKNSNLYSSSWSGNISFAIDNDLHLIMPKVIANYYNLNNGGVIPYTDENDILTQIELKNGYEYKKHLQIIRDKTYESNCEAWNLIYNKTQK